MTLDELRQSLSEDAPPASLDLALAALWRDAKGDWDAAHRLAQEDKSDSGSWVHAYLHRKEGDLSNAGYWYRRAGRPVHEGTLDEEWADIAQALLAGT